MKYISEQFWS